MTDTGIISGVRVTYERADVDEIASVGTGDTRTDVAGLVGRPAVEEAYVLRTCNRVEAYVVTESADTGRSILETFVANVDEDVVVETGHEDSLRHLMRVAAGLESMVLGEDRVLGQVRDAYETARGVDGIGPVLEEGVTKAIHVGEQVRTETEINDGVVSMGSAAAEFLDDRIGLTGTTAAVVGAGDIATSVADALAARGVEPLVVINRTVENAVTLAKAVDTSAEAKGLEALPSAAERADVLVSATGSRGPLIDEETLVDAGTTWIIDMGQPRDVAPGVDDLPPVRRYDLDALEDLTEQTRKRRQAAADRAEAIIDEEFEHLLDRYKRKRADEVIAAMHAGAEQVKERQLRTALRKMNAEGELSEQQREVVESLADALVSQLLAAPTKSLRDAAEEDDWKTIATALELFDPEFGSDPPPFADDDTQAVPASSPSPSDDDA